MPKKLDLDNTESFGQRMAKLRHAAGYSQRDLAKETGISQRMIKGKGQHRLTAFLVNTGGSMPCNH